MGDARWLSEEEGNTWHHFVQAYHLLERQIEQQLQRDAGLSHAQYNVLVVLSEQPGNRLRMTELARRVVVSKSSLTYQIGKLEKAGLVRREPHESDERGILAVLTEAGKDLLNSTAPGHVETVRAYLIDLFTPRQLAQLGEFMQVVHEKADD
ncbi:MarR family winged helix-turn-helix transcriptional regulator [Lentzea nigeriaca]|uniref:MarR family winged helix-turn-helix transcriptional regulator n=1 Tax=Lentzea nigeriaca TaxID=1128665 RepID=UPI001EF7BE0D|nr:MarR family transcriptional regulator [Lentzea nigeriaca]MBM7859428.1 DNA-binding MarR family transcriptional regulator [Lentzea nigeriaca]